LQSVFGTGFLPEEELGFTREIGELWLLLLGDLERVGARDFWGVQTIFEVSNAIIADLVIIFSENLLSGEMLIPPPTTTAMLWVKHKFAPDSK
jgi:hypothetical protein